MSNNKKKGILLVGGQGTRLYPTTKNISKHMLPLYNVPLVYYPLSTLITLGIEEILVIVSPEHEQIYRNTLGDGRALGLSIHYQVQNRPDGVARAILLAEEFIGSDMVTLILGDNVFHGDKMNGLTDEATIRIDRATIFSYRVNDPSEYGVIKINNEGIPICLEEKPRKPCSNLAVPGLYFYDNNVIEIIKSVNNSNKKELNISEVNKVYLSRDMLDVIDLSDEVFWIDVGSPENFMIASEKAYRYHLSTGKMMACLEEKVVLRGLITKKDVIHGIKDYPTSDYKTYIENLDL